MADLLRRSALDAQQLDCVETIRSCGDALLAVINDVLDMSKLEAGMVMIDPVPFELRALMTSVLRVVAGPAQTKGLELACEVAADLPRFVRGDEARIRQILINLLGNGVKFTSHGRVGLRVSLQDRVSSRVRFEVRDTGIGIPERAMHRLFKEFSQVDATINRQFGGTGLGLAICKRLVEAMGGAIGVTSLEGEGSTFWFELPLQTSSAPAQPAIAASSGTIPPLQILLVEDILVNQKVAIRMLNSLGHTVDVADNGQEALEKVQSRAYDLIFMDMQMPRMNGLEATAAMRAMGGVLATVPIVAMTANFAADNRNECLAAGMDDFVAKPVNATELDEAIRRVVARRQERTAAGAKGGLDRGQLEALAALIDAEDLIPIVDAFDRDAAAVLQELRADNNGAEHRTRLLRTLRDGTAALGFSQAAQLCEEAMTAAELDPGAVDALEGAIDIAVAAARILLSDLTRSRRRTAAAR
jgi:CheY-like chemotaxis protein